MNFKNNIFVSNLFHQKYILKLAFLFSRNSPEKTTPTCISTRGKLRLRLLKAKNAVSKCLYPEYLILTRFLKKCKSKTQITINTFNCAYVLIFLKFKRNGECFYGLNLTHWYKAMRTNFFHSLQFLGMNEPPEETLWILLAVFDDGTSNLSLRSVSDNVHTLKF